MLHFSKVFLRAHVNLCSFSTSFKFLLVIIVFFIFQFSWQQVAFTLNAAAGVCQRVLYASPDDQVIRSEMRRACFSYVSVGTWSRPLYRPKRDRKSKSNEDFYYY